MAPTPTKPPEAKKPLTEDEELAALEAENDALTRRARIVELREKNEVLRKKLDKGAEETFVNAKGVRVPVRFKGTFQYTVMKPIYRPGGSYLMPGETIELTDERPSKALRPLVKKDVAKVTTFEPAPAKKATEQAV